MSYGLFHLSHLLRRGTVEHRMNGGDGEGTGVPVEQLWNTPSL